MKKLVLYIGWYCSIFIAIMLMRALCVAEHLNMRTAFDIFGLLIDITLACNIYRLREIKPKDKMFM